MQNIIITFSHGKSALCNNGAINKKIESSNVNILMNSIMSFHGTNASKKIMDLGLLITPQQASISLR